MRKILLVFSVLLLTGCKTTKDEIKDLKIQVNTLKKNVVNKNEFQFEIDLLKDKIKDLQKEIDKIKKVTNNKNINSKNKLLSRIIQLEKQYNYLQNEIKKLNLSVAKISSKKRNSLECLKEFFKPTVFITKNKANIYDSNNKMVDVWDKCVTFTSYIKKGDKLKITGYFVNRKFKSALDKDWWIKIDDVKRKFKGIK
jgi:chromosome segregation ATPase